MQRFTRKHRLRAGLAALAVTTAIGTAACSSSPTSSTAATSPAGSTSQAASGSCKAGAVKLTFWAWAPGYNLVVNQFNKTHPDICVVLDDVGGGNAEYAKLNEALKSDNGIPDVAEVEYIELPSLEITHSLVNLVPYGIESYKSQIVPSSWAEVSQGSAVYAMPGDIGPLGFYYDTKELAKYHLARRRRGPSSPPRRPPCTRTIPRPTSRASPPPKPSGCSRSCRSSAPSRSSTPAGAT
jgi:multiple sugar transport system substrate-binding protein